MAATRIVFDPSIRKGVESSLNYLSARSSDEIELLYQQTSFEGDDDEKIPEVPQVEDGSFVYLIVRRAGVGLCEHPVEFYTVPSSDAFNPRRYNAMEDMHEIEQKDTLMDMIADEVRGGVLGEEDYTIGDEDDDEEEVVIRRGQLLEVDQTIHHKGCTLLRLADHSGWIAAEWKGRVAARRLEVDIGLWSWCIDNFAGGFAVRNHPSDGPELFPSEQLDRQMKFTRKLLPFQKVYCDMRVKHPETGVVFYRLQSCSSSHVNLRRSESPPAPHLQTPLSADTRSYDGTEALTVATPVRGHARTTCMTSKTASSHGWVFDRSHDYKAESSCEPEDRFWLIDDSLVDMHRFMVFCAQTEDLFIQTQPDVLYRHQRRDGRRIEKNEMVLVTLVRRAPDFSKEGCGPFLYLADGSGWVYQNRNHHPVMKQVDVEIGCWECLVQNETFGIVSYEHPMHTRLRHLTDRHTLAHNSVIQCDRKVTNPVHGTCFYRILGTEEWVPDLENEKRVLRVLSFTQSRIWDDDQVSTQAWSPDFVRGIIAIACVYKEDKFEGKSKVMTFKHSIDKSVKLHVFFKTRTVGIVIGRSLIDQRTMFRRNCSPKELLDFIMADPSKGEPIADVSEATDAGEEKKESEEFEVKQQQLQVFSNTDLREREDEFRQMLLNCNLQMKALMDERRRLLRHLTTCDEIRAGEVSKVLKLESNEEEEDAPDDNTTAVLSGQSEDTGTCLSTDREGTVDPDDETIGESTIGEGTVADGDIFNEEDDIRKKIAEMEMSRKAAPSPSTQSTASSIFSGFLSYATPTINNNSAKQCTVKETRSDDDATAMLSVASSRKQNFFCGECKKSFNGKYSRDIHCREIHGLNCKICETVFASRPILESHMRIHHP